MKNINEVESCYGCFACMSKCPKQCISIVKDKLGHLYPYANEDCIECKACLKVCPSINFQKLNEPAEVYAAVGKNCKVIEKSSSGGIATILAQEIIYQGGVVYGCAFQKEFDFKHIRCEALQDLERLKGSKYVQSNISDVYTLIRKDLKDKRKVLFIGTPCQVAAVKTYFKDNNILYTVDLICHGVPSVKILKDSLPKNVALDSNIENISFRDKKSFQLKIYNGDGIFYTRPLSKDLYLKGFFKSLFYRKSCFSCKYASIDRNADITIGDFWGLKNKMFDDYDGVSLCIINTNNGKKLFNEIKNDIIYDMHNIDEARYYNKQLNHPSFKTLSVNVFQHLYSILGFKLSVMFSIPGIIIKNLLKNER